MKKKSQKKGMKRDQGSTLPEETQNLSDETQNISQKEPHEETGLSIVGSIEFLVNFEQDDFLNSLNYHFNKISKKNEQFLSEKLVAYIAEAIRQWKIKNPNRVLSGSVLVQCQVDVLENFFRSKFCSELCHLSAEYILQIKQKNNHPLNSPLSDFSNCQIQYLTNPNELSQTITPLETSFTSISEKTFLSAEKDSTETTLTSLIDLDPEVLGDSDILQLAEVISAIRILAKDSEEIVDTLKKLENYLETIRMVIAKEIENVFNKFEGEKFDAETTKVVASLMDRIAKSVSLRFLAKTKGGEQFLSSIRAGMVNAELYRFRFVSIDKGKQTSRSSSNSLPQSVLRVSEPDPRRSNFL